MSKRPPYPCTIIADRYDGTYSGAPWIAFNREAHDVPDGHCGSDTEAMAFWEMAGIKRKWNEPIGRGASPGEAMDDLARQLALKGAPQ